MSVYTAYKRNRLEELAGATVKVALLASSYTPDLGAHEFFADVQAHEVSGSGYTAGGKALSGKTVTQNNADAEGVFDADNVEWAGATITARYAVVYIDTGDAATSRLVSLYDFGTDYAAAGGTFRVVWNNGGVTVIR